MAELIEYLQDKPKVARILITTSDGELIGLLRRDETERRLAGIHDQHAHDGHEGQHAA
jgi:hypothetical protein